MIFKRLMCLVALVGAAPAFAGSLIFADSLIISGNAGTHATGGAASKVVPVVVEAPAAPIPTFELVKGKRVDEQLRAFGKRSGWDLIWQAPDYVLDQNMIIQGDFEPAVLFFLKGTNEAGSRLRAIFYRGNKTVRVTEF